MFTLFKDEPEYAEALKKFFPSFFQKFGDKYMVDLLIDRPHWCDYKSFSIQKNIVNINDNKLKNQYTIKYDCNYPQLLFVAHFYKIKFPYVKFEAYQKEKINVLSTFLSEEEKQSIMNKEFTFENKTFTIFNMIEASLDLVPKSEFDYLIKVLQDFQQLEKIQPEVLIKKILYDKNENAFNFLIEKEVLKASTQIKNNENYLLIDLFENLQKSKFDFQNLTPIVEKLILDNKVKSSLEDTLEDKKNIFKI